MGARQGRCFLRLIPAILLVLLLGHGVAQSSAEETDAASANPSARGIDTQGISLEKARLLCEKFLGRSTPGIKQEHLFKLLKICNDIKNSGLSEAAFQTQINQDQELLAVAANLYKTYLEQESLKKTESPKQTSETTKAPNNNKENEAADTFTPDVIVAMVFGVLVAVGRWSLSLSLSV